MKFTKLFTAIGLGAALASVVAIPAQARELKVAIGLAQSSSAYYGLDALAKSVKEKTAGEIDLKLFAMSLLNLSQTFAGIRDGVVDGGLLLTPLAPSELPETQLPNDLAMLGVNSWAMAGAMTEYNFTCQECLADRLKANHVYLGSGSSAPLVIMSTKKISTVDDVKGKKLRSAGAAWSRWVTSLGGVAVSIPANEVFEAISQGTVDGTVIAGTELSALRLIDVVKHITNGVPGGTYHAIDTLNINRNTWRSLTEAQRRAFLDAAAMGSAAMTWKYAADGSTNMKDAQTKGIQFYQPAPDLVARTKAFVEADLAVVGQLSEKNYGIKNASQKIARFKQLVEKWEKLTPANVNWEPAALAEIYRREIFSKIDAKTYGM